MRDLRRSSERRRAFPARWSSAVGVFSTTTAADGNHADVVDGLGHSSSDALRLVDSVLARRGVDVGLREALGTIARYVIITLGALVKLCRARASTLPRSTFSISTMGVGLGFGLQNIASNSFSGLILLLERPVRMRK